MLSISLGQGQGPVAEKMFIESMEVGNWVFFQVFDSYFKRGYDSDQNWCFNTNITVDVR